MRFSLTQFRSLKKMTWHLVTSVALLYATITPHHSIFRRYVQLAKIRLKFLFSKNSWCAVHFILYTVYRILYISINVLLVEHLWTLYLNNLSSLELLTLQSVHEQLWSSHVTGSCWSSWSSPPLTSLLVSLSLAGCHHFQHSPHQT